MDKEELGMGSRGGHSAIPVHFSGVTSRALGHSESLAGVDSSLGFRALPRVGLPLPCQTFPACRNGGRQTLRHVTASPLLSSFSTSSWPEIALTLCDSHCYSVCLHSRHFWRDTDKKLTFTIGEMPKLKQSLFISRSIFLHTFMSSSPMWWRIVTNLVGLVVLHVHNILHCITINVIEKQYYRTLGHV